jgi:hypothetical protein
MHLKYESQLREPLVYGDKTYHQVTEDIVKPIESVSYLNVFITKFLYIFLFICITSLNSACNKKDIEVVNESSQKNEFFKRNDSYKNTFNEINLGYADEKILNEIITKYGEIDKKTLLSKKVKNFIGQPLWDISYALKNEDGKVVLVTPFEKDYKNKSFFLISYLRKNGEINYKLIDENNKQNKLKTTTTNSSLSRSAFSSLIKFCKSLRDKYFSNSSVIRVGSDQTTTNSTTYFTFDCWYEYSSDADGYTTTKTHCRYRIIFSASNVNELEPTSEIEGYGNSGGGGAGDWISTAVSPNQHIIDSLSGYPCAQTVLLQMPDCNEQIKSILSDVFGVNDEVNIKFTVNSNLHDTVVGQERVTNGSLTSYMSTVELNPKYLFGSQDFIAATLLHEAIHAYISYQRRNLDSTTFKTKFPIYWEFRNNEAQHNEMASNYLNMIKNFIKGINANISNDVAEALAWGGLTKTDTWKSKSSTDKAKILNINYLCANPTQGTIDSLKLKKCL